MQRASTNTVRSPHFLVGGTNDQNLHTPKQSKVQQSARAWRVQSRAFSYFIYLFIDFCFIIYESIVKYNFSSTQDLDVCENYKGKL